MVTDKPLKTFVYLPVFLKGEYKCCAPFKMQGAQIKVGDIFTVDKRPPTFDEQREIKEFKVVKVQYNVFHNDFAEQHVELEPVVFNDQKQIDRFMNGKNKL